MSWGGWGGAKREEEADSSLTWGLLPGSRIMKGCIIINILYFCFDGNIMKSNLSEILYFLQCATRSHVCEAVFIYPSELDHILKSLTQLILVKSSDSRQKAGKITMEGNGL